MFEGKVEVRSSGELIDKLHQILLRGNSNIKPYKNAIITIEKLHPKALAPAQRYVLRSELRKIEQLRWAIDAEYGQDILRLNGYLKIEYPESEIVTHYEYGLGKLEPVGEVTEPIPAKTIDILPPVVEEYIDYNGYIRPLVCDGMHRAFLAYQMDMPLHVAYVRGVNKNYPYYSYPLPEKWNNIEILDVIPKGYIKKFHVAKDHKFLYRDFNSQFRNVGDSRPYDKPAESEGPTGPIGQCEMGKENARAAMQNREAENSSSWV